MLRPAPLIKFPAATDSNSPAHWDGSTLYLFNSDGTPRRSSGPDLFHLGGAAESRFNTTANGGRWIECTWKADDGMLYAWYHHEPAGLIPGSPLTAPKIGAVRSRDNGATFEDLGIVLEARPGTLRPDAKNGFFAGGHGDFSVMLDPSSEFLYVLFGNYAGEVSEQGVCVARMRWADRDAPAGKVWKWHAGGWTEPGSRRPCHADLARGDRLGPRRCRRLLGPFDSLELASASVCDSPESHQGEAGLAAGGHLRLVQPGRRGTPGWSRPRKLLDKGAWYPQVLGLDASRHETDKRAGRVARFFMAGESRWELVFRKPGEPPEPVP